jgi:hypothetical protein
MERFKHSVLLMIALALVFVFAGCFKKPPEKEINAAKAAMDAALAANADKYVPTEFEAAKDLWDKAQLQTMGKKYNEAKQFYIEAKAAFEKSMGGIEAGKKALAESMPATLAGIDADWKKLQANFKENGKGLSMDEWNADVKAYAEGQKTAKELIATDPAAAKVKADELKAMIAKWNTAIKDLKVGGTIGF